MGSNMKKSVAVLLILVVCAFSTISAIQNKPKTPLELGKEYCLQNAVRLEKEHLRNTEDYIKARQVPMGQAVCSEELIHCMEQYSYNTIFYVGVSFAAMVPTNKSQFSGLTAELMELAQADCVEAGMCLQFEYPNSHLFYVFATKRQLLEMSCSSDVALYFHAGVGYS